MALAALLGASISIASAQQGDDRRDRRGDPAYDFDSRGIQEGEVVPELTVRTLEGREVELPRAWGDGPALLVTCSLTCPVARGHQEQVERIAEEFEGRLAVRMLYTIEAHPVTDPSPYSGEEWVTSPNREEGILVRQPQRLEERRELAAAYRDRLGVELPMLIDRMTNEAWKSLGGGPNMALMIGSDGKVQVKHGWFDAESMKESIEHYLQRRDREEGTTSR